MEYETLSEFLGFEYDQKSPIEEVALNIKTEVFLGLHYEHLESSRISGYLAFVFIRRLCPQSFTISTQIDLHSTLFTYHPPRL